MKKYIIRYRPAQWFLIAAMTLCSIGVAFLGVYALQTTPTLYTESEIVTVRQGIQITQIGDQKLRRTDLWKLPAFTSVEREQAWWETQDRLYDLIKHKESVVISFFDETETSWELISDVGRMSVGDILTRIGLIYVVVCIYIVASISVFRRHATTTGFLCAFFLSSSALYLASVAPVVHRPIVMDPDILRLLVSVFFVASTGQISIVHFSVIFPKRKQILRNHRLLVAVFYLYSAVISVLYMLGAIALATTLPFLIFWILLMLSSFVHSMIHLDDEFMKKQVRITFIAPLLVATFFIVSIVLPWPEGGTLVNNYALFSLMLPVALILSLDNQRLYKDRLAIEYNARAEKERIHRELHDTVLNDLASISIVTEGAERFASEPDKIKARIQRVKEYASESSRRLRNFLWVIDDRQNTWEDVANSLRRFGYDLLGHSDIEFDLEASGTQQEIKPPTTAIKHTIHQVFREALINITKHAQASTVRSSLTFGSSCAIIVISDDGTGMDPHEADTEGHGLQNMKRRIKEHGGELMIDTRPGEGTRIIAQLPIK